MTDQENKHLSKKLSYILRHHPDSIGLVLDKNGWANVEELLEKLNASGTSVNLENLREVVSTNAKQRFSFDEGVNRIRANQGHSINIALGLASVKPPSILYHGTATVNREAILSQGLTRQQRQHVHLSADISTAIQVGQRHGKPFIFEVDTKAMHAAGFTFFRSENNVWLTDHVPPQFLSSASV